MRQGGCSPADRQTMTHSVCDLAHSARILIVKISQETSDAPPLAGASEQTVEAILRSRVERMLNMLDDADDDTAI